MNDTFSCNFCFFPPQRFSLLLRVLLTYDRHLFVLMQLQAALLVFHPLMIIDYSLLQQHADETEAISSMVYQLMSLILEVHSTLNKQNKNHKLKLLFENCLNIARKHLRSDTLARPASVVTGTLGISRSFMFGLISYHIKKCREKKQSFVCKKNSQNKP